MRPGLPIYKLTIRVYGQIMSAISQLNSRQHQRENTRGQILEAAIAVFAQSGFDIGSGKRFEV